MGRFADLSIPKGDLDLDDEDLVESMPTEIEEGVNLLPEAEKSKNLIIKVVANNQQKGVRVKLNTYPIPRAFDLDYYQSKIDQANFNNDRAQAYKFVVIKKYADIVYEFYRNIMYLYNKKHDITDMPEYIKMSEKVPCDVEALAETMQNREQDLIRAFEGSNNVISFFEKRKHLTELQHFAGQAWMMYFNLKSLNDFIGYLSFIQNCNESANLTNNSHVANLYGLHVQTGYYLDANIKNFFNTYNNGFLSRKCPKTSGMYSNLNSMEEFNILLKDKNAYVYADNHEKIKELSKNVTEGSIEKRIVGFYNHYRDMKYIKHKLKHIYAKHAEEIGVNDAFMFLDVNNPVEKYSKRDTYLVGYKYYVACKSLIEQLPVKSKIYSDICDMCAEFEEILLLNQDKFIICKQEQDRLTKELQKNYPNVCLNLEEEKKLEKESNFISE